MSDLTKARLKTFFVLAIVIELIVVGMAYFYHGIMNETLNARVSILADQIVTEANAVVKTQLTKIEGITQQLLLDPRARKEIQAIQLGTFDGVTEKVAVTDIRNQLTAMKYLDPNIVTIRLFPRSNIQLEQMNLNHFLMSMPLMAYNSTPLNKQGMQEFSDSDGKMVWIPTLAKGFFYDPTLDKTKDFPGNTLTLGRVLKDVKHPEADMTMIVEVNVKMIQDALKSVAVGKNSNIVLTDAQNRIVYGPDLNLVGSNYAYQATNNNSGTIFQDDNQVVMRVPIEGMTWSLNLEYSKAEYMQYLQTVYVSMLVGMTVLVLVISFALAWIMNRPYEEEYQESYV